MNPAKNQIVILTDSNLNITNITHNLAQNKIPGFQLKTGVNLKTYFRLIDNRLDWKKMIETGWGTVVRKSPSYDHESFFLKVFDLTEPMPDGTKLIWSIQSLNNVQDLYGSNQAMLEYNYFKKIFLGCVHEINNLLGTISGYSNILQNILNGHDEYVKMAETVETDGFRAGEILRALSLLVQSHKTQRKKLADNAFVQNMQMLLNKVMNRQLEKKFFSDENLYHPIMPPGNLYWLLIILSLELDKLVNGKGLFTFSAQNIKNYDQNNPYGVRFRVGLALEENVTPDLSEIEPLCDASVSGMNLNFPIQFSLVTTQLNQFGGKLHLESEENRVVFVLDIPAVLSPKLQKTDDGTTQLDGQGKTVLLVDDEESILLLMDQFLTHHNFKCIKAGDGREAVEIVNKKGLDLELVILDYMMPEMDGEKVYDYIANFFPELPVVFLTGLEDENRIDRLRKKGVQTIIRKPFTGIEVLRAIKQNLAV